LHFCPSNPHCAVLRGALGAGHRDDRENAMQAHAAAVSGLSPGMGGLDLDSFARSKKGGGHHLLGARLSPGGFGNRSYSREGYRAVT
jgi:hypothetical protein